MNDSKELENSFKEIYPAELELKKENANDNEATFLHINIIIKEGQFSTKLYYKRDGFNFSIVSLSYKYNNMPSKMFYSTISAKIWRICRATPSYKDFLSSVHRLMSPMKKQGDEVNDIIQALSKMIFQNTKDFLKLNIE